MTGVIRLALFWHWQLAEKKKKRRENHITEMKSKGRQKRGLDR